MGSASLSIHSLSYSLKSSPGLLSIAEIDHVQHGPEAQKPLPFRDVTRVWVEKGDSANLNTKKKEGRNTALDEQRSGLQFCVGTF